MGKKGSGGSQLSQLKNRIHSEGLHAFAQPGGSKKGKGKAVSAETGALKRSEKLAALSSSFSSAFDTKISKPKHEVLGKKTTTKGAVGRPAAAKSGGIAAREATLLPELKSRHKSGSFVDRRFGENDANVSLEQRMLERFTKERQRERSSRGKESLFNLNDGEEEGLTHYGRSLSAMDNGDDELGLPSDDEGSPLEMPGEDASEDEDADPDRPRSKAEIMAEVMLKSKMAKHERQQIKEADDDVRHELDEQLDGDLREMLMSVPSALGSSKDGPSEPLVKSRKRLLEEEMKAREEERAKAGVPSTVPAGGRDKAQEAPDAAPSASSSKVAAAGTAPPAYDAVLRELAFERRAKPSDRLKTDAELAAEEAKRLQASERERQRRMRGDDSDEDADGDAATGKKRKRGAAGAKERRRAPGGDDLDDDFELEGVTAGEAYGLGAGLQAGSSDEESEEGVEIEEDSASEDASEGSADGEQEEENEDGEDDEEDEHNYNDLADLDGLAQPGEDFDSDEEQVAGGAAEALVGGERTKGKKKSRKSTAVEEPAKDANSIPFTFPCPTTHADLLDIIEDNKIATKDVPTVIKRVRTLYHASLAEDNKHKLQSFLRVLIDHVIYTADQAQRASAAAHASGPGAEDATAEVKVNVALLNSLLTPIFDMSKTYTATSAHAFVSKLRLMQRNLTRGLAAQTASSLHSANASSIGARTWPSFAELSFFRIAGLVWPTSDRQHAVATPMMILIAQYLAHCRIRASSAVPDIASGLYLCTLVASFEKESKRLVPEAMNFLHLALALLAPMDKKARRQVQAKAAEAGIPLMDVDNEHLRRLRLTSWPVASGAAEAPAAQAPAPLLELLTFSGDLASPAGTKAREQLLTTVIRLLKTFAEMYNASEGYVELFEPVAQVLAASGAARGSAASADLAKSLGKRIDSARSSRRALRLQAHRALAIASYVPKFEQSGYNPRSRFDPDAERAEHAKLKALLKKERKGAVRELRRDAQFVAQVREGERREEEKTYKKKIDRIMGDLQAERSEEKKLEKEKARMKKRR